MEHKSTPNKNIHKSSSGFSPVSLSQKSSGPTQQNLTGLPRVIRDLAVDVHNNIQKWNELHVTGALLVKQIVQERANNPKKYTAVLEGYADQLQKVVEELDPCVKYFKVLTTQARAVDDLQRKHEAVISKNLQSMAVLIEKITDLYSKDYSDKKTVLENIAHSKNESEAMFFASCWTLQCNVANMGNEYLEALLTEVGLRTIEC